MIWRDQTATIPETQETYRVTGELNNSTVTILIWYRNLQSILFVKILSGMRHEEPTAEDVDVKFGWKIDKFISSVTLSTMAKRFGLIEETHKPE